MYASTDPQEDIFSSFGAKPTDVKLLSGFGFVEYDSIPVSSQLMPEMHKDGKYVQLRVLPPLPRTLKMLSKSSMDVTSWATGEFSMLSISPAIRCKQDGQHTYQQKREPCSYIIVTQQTHGSIRQIERRKRSPTLQRPRPIR